MNINASKIRPASCIKFFGLFSPMDGTPANRLFPSLRDSASTSNNAPINAKFLSRNWMSHKIEYATVWNALLNLLQVLGTLPIKRDLTCKTTMKNNIPQAIVTLYLAITRAQPPNCPKRLTSTKTVAKNCEWTKIFRTFFHTHKKKLISHFATTPTHVHVLPLFVPLHKHPDSIFEECWNET